MAVVSALALAALACDKSAAPQYLTEPLSRGTVTESVSATGEVSALIKVNVGSQVSGTIAKLNVDFNTRVHKDQILAEIDPRLFLAGLERSNASVAVADADVEKAKVTVLDAERSQRRTTELAKKKMVAQSDVDTADVNYAGAVAALKGAEARLLQARADRDLAATNLAFTKIRSPIDGVIIDRAVDVGQTVAASFQVATLFVIANDLRRMQILANIDEADIGKIKEGMPARFSVDAYPNDVFTGTISAVRQAPSGAIASAGVPASGNNVVTYAAVVQADNPEGKLRQGMTARVTVLVRERAEALRVPTAALRFKPSTPGKQDDLPAPPVAAASATPPAPPPAPGAPRQANVYRLDQGKAVPVTVHVGLSDGHHAELIDGLSADAVVIIGEVLHAAGKRRGNF